MLLSNVSDILMISLRKAFVFFGGIFIGILIVLFVYLIITIISNRLKSKSIKKQIENTFKKGETIHAVFISHFHYN